VIAFVLITRFRSAIDDFLKRLVEGNIFGQEFKAVPPERQSDSAGVTEDGLAKAAEASAQLPEPQPAQVQQLPPELAGDPLAPAAVAYVRNNPAQTVLEYKRVLFAYNSEKLFARIYGTQIELLEFLAARRGDPATLTLLVRFHEEHQQKVGSADYPLWEYVAFLVNFGVVAVAGPESAREYSVTQHGLEFLSYIKTNYPHHWNKRAY
jgi:hypothetical protein